jgi:ATP-dependent RNA helicase RhlE
MTFDSLGLSAALQRSVAEHGYAQPTPVQTRVVPVVLEAKDVVVCSQTGTGKTAAFTLPLLQRLAKTAPMGRRRVRALVLTPTRELAAQVAASVKGYGKFLPLKCAVVFGGVNIKRQIDELYRGVDILVATPGRLLDHVSQATVDLSQVEILVLDEADRMLDMGFLPDVRRILALLPTRRQTLLFSATLSHSVRELAKKFMSAPVHIDIARPSASVEPIEQGLHRVDKAQKRALLAWLIGEGNWSQVLVFTRTKHGANRLAQQLTDDGLATAAIHGNKSQAARTRALAAFKQRSVRVLVATDIAARGLDIDRLPYVVNYELPDTPEHYVHRIGRTGRAGRVGIALSLVSREERGLLADIERLLGHGIPEKPLPDHLPRSAASPRASSGEGNGPAARRHDSKRHDRRPRSGGQARASGTRPGNAKGRHPKRGHVAAAPR